MVQQGDTLLWSLTEPSSGSWWATHALWCYSTSLTKDVWTRADPDGSGGWQAPSASSGVTAGIAYNKSTQTWTDENTSAGEEPHNPVGYTSLSPTGTVVSTNPEFVRIQITSGSTVQRVWITSPYYSSGTGASGSGSSGTNTGSIEFDVLSSEITLTIDANSESDGTIDYKVTWLKGLTVYNYGPYFHSLGTADSYNISSNESMVGTWRLITDNGNTITVLDEVVVGGSSYNPPHNNSPNSGTQKKVFCNFW